MLSNFQLDNRPLVQCFLLGQPEFRAKLAQPEMEQIRQRVIATCHLEPLAVDETKVYIEHRLKLVGWEGNPKFTEKAFLGIYRSTNGVPRRINALCGRLLLYGSLENTLIIDDEVVEKVVNEIITEGGFIAEEKGTLFNIDSFSSESGETLADLDRRVAELRGLR